MVGRDILYYESWSVVFDDFTLDETVTRAKFLIFSRTIEIPRSSEAFNSRTRVFINSGLQLVNSTGHPYPNNSLHKARIVDVFPVPGGP